MPAASDPVAAQPRAAFLEPGPGIASGLRDLRRHLNAKTVSAGTVATIFGCSGPALIVIGAAQAGGLTSGQTVAWLFSIYFLGGLISLLMALHYKQPITGAWSIPGAAILIAALGSFDFAQAVGAFIMAGVLVLLLGFSGLIGRIMRWLPMPIVMAMIAGALIRFGTGIITSAGAAPWIAGVTILAFFATQRFASAVPPVLAALLAGIVMTLALGAFTPPAVGIGSVLPAFTLPHFTLDAFLAIAVPLAILVIGAENAQATGILIAEGYRPPINAMTIISGIGGILAGLLGGHNANIAGPMTAICASDQAGEDKESRYAATVVNGVLFGAFGLVAGFAVTLIAALPKTLIAIVAGLAMMNVLVVSFQEAFSRAAGYQVGAFFALVVAISEIKLLGISAPFWALVIGTAASLALGEKEPERTSVA